MKTKSVFIVFFILLLENASLAQVSIRDLYRKQALVVRTLSDTLWIKNVDKYPGINPILENDNVYIGLNKTGLSCVNVNTGNVIWKLDKIDCIGKIALYANEIYCCSKSNEFYAVDKISGKILWKRNIEFDEDILSEILVDENFIYINSSSNQIYKISKKGNVVYIKKLNRKLLALVSFKDEIECIGNDGTYSVINKSNGKIKKEIKVFSGFKKKVYNIGKIENKLFISNDIDTIFVIDLETNKIIKEILSQNLFIENKTLYCYNDTSFSKFNEKFEKVWYINDIDCKWFLQPTLKDDKLILQTRFLILDINNISGGLNYLIEFSAKSYTKPIILADNSVIMGYTSTFERRKLPNK